MKILNILIIAFVLLYFFKKIKLFLISRNLQKFEEVKCGSPPPLGDLPYHMRYNLKYTKNNVDVYARNVLGYSPCKNFKYPGDYLN